MIRNSEVAAKNAPATERLKTRVTAIVTPSVAAADRAAPARLSVPPLATAPSPARSSGSWPPPLGDRTGRVALLPEDRGGVCPGRPGGVVAPQHRVGEHREAQRRAHRVVAEHVHEAEQ